MHFSGKKGFDTADDTQSLNLCKRIKKEMKRAPLWQEGV